jgi:putative membrane protein
MALIIALLLNALALIVTEKIVPGFYIENFSTAVVSALVMGLINTLVKPLLNSLTVPQSAISIMLFSFVINAILIYFAALIVPGFIIQGAWDAILGAIVLSFIATGLSFGFRKTKLLKNRKLLTH